MACVFIDCVSQICFLKGSKKSFGQTNTTQLFTSFEFWHLKSSPLGRNLYVQVAMDKTERKKMTFGWSVQCVPRSRNKDDEQWLIDGFYNQQQMTPSVFWLVSFFHTVSLSGPSATREPSCKSRIIRRHLADKAAIVSQITSVPQRSDRGKQGRSLQRTDCFGTVMEYLT